MFYPVLREQEATMRTKLVGMAKADYPEHLLRVISIPNHDDAHTSPRLRSVPAEFPFLEVLPVPPTMDPSWIRCGGPGKQREGVLVALGGRAAVKNLPPKKTSQLVWAMYRLATG